MPVLIDGYNLLRAVQKMQEQMEFPDTELCAVLCEYLRRTGETGVIVFDGIGPPNKAGLMGLGILQVVFSGQHTEADTIIEHYIQDNTAPKRLMVVSSDRRILSAAKRRKCPGVGAIPFWLQVCQVIEKPLPVSEPKEKRHGIGTRETQQWLDAFGLAPQKASDPRHNMDPFPKKHKK